MTFRALIMAACCTLAAGAAGAQTPGRVFVDGSIAVDRDPTESFNGSDVGTAFGGAIGFQLSERNGLRFEFDVPGWRSATFSSDSPVYCAPGAGCVNGPGSVPARTTTNTSVRSVSYSFIYARTLNPASRLRVALLGGGGIEQRDARSSGSFDELDAAGRVLRHNAYTDDRSRTWPAIVLGADAEVLLTPHFSLVPRMRFHTFPYPHVSIFRPGVAVRWTF